MWMKTNMGVVQLCFLLFVVSVGSDKVEEHTLLAGTEDFILCTGHAERTDTYLWTDVSTNPNVRIYTVNEEITKTEESKEIEKYDNFLIENSFPVATALAIADIELEDSGTYTCELLAESTIEGNYTVHVEVAPRSLLLTCLGIDECPPPPPDDVPSKVDCICTANGVFPESLQFLGNGHPTVHKIIDPSFIGPEGSFDISSDFIVYPTPSVNEFQCTLTGFINTVNPVQITASYTFRPPICELEITPHGGCLTASLTCTCNNAAPGVVVYSFYDETKTAIGLPQTYSIKDVPIRPNERMVFYCRGCNGVNYGAHSFAENTAQCNTQQLSTSASTVKPTTSRSETVMNNIGLGFKLLLGQGLFLLAVL